MVGVIVWSVLLFSDIVITGGGLLERDKKENLNLKASFEFVCLEIVQLEPL